MKRNREVWPRHWEKKKQATETPIKVTNVGFNRDFNSHYKYVQQTKENMIKEIDMMTVSHQIENISKEKLF